MTTTNTRPIIVGVDGSAGSREALAWAADQALATDARVEAIIAWHLPEAYALEPRDYEAEAMESLDAIIADTLTADQRQRVTGRAVTGQPGAVLVEESRHAQMLVVGQHGHASLLVRLIGSTSEHCVHHAFCPVVVVRNKTP